MKCDICGAGECAAKWVPYCDECALLVATAIQGLRTARHDGAVKEGWTPSNYKEQPIWEQVAHAIEHLYALRTGAKDEDHGAHAICRVIMAVAVASSATQ